VCSRLQLNTSLDEKHVDKAELQLQLLADVQ